MPFGTPVSDHGPSMAAYRIDFRYEPGDKPMSIEFANDEWDQLDEATADMLAETIMNALAETGILTDIRAVKHWFGGTWQTAFPSTPQN